MKRIIVLLLVLLIISHIFCMPFLCPVFEKKSKSFAIAASFVMESSAFSVSGMLSKITLGVASKVISNSPVSKDNKFPKSDKTQNNAASPISLQRIDFQYEKAISGYSPLVFHSLLSDFADSHLIKYELSPSPPNLVDVFLLIKIMILLMLMLYSFPRGIAGCISSVTIYNPGLL